jgi:head-tail adaptor
VPRNSHIGTSSLRERLTVRTQSVSDLGGGAVTVTDGGTVRLWAEITPTDGREELQARQLVAGTPYRVTLRRPLPTGTTITSDTRLVWEAPDGDVTLHLVSPPVMTKDRRHLTFRAIAKEVTS